MPWLAAGPLQQAAPVQTAPVQTAAVTATPKATPQPALRPVQPVIARETLAAASVIEPPGQASKSTEEQWAMLVASVEENSAGQAARTPLPQTRSGDGQGHAKVRPADLAATMVLALDRYEAISRDRYANSLAE